MKDDYEDVRGMKLTYCRQNNDLKAAGLK